jgi:hypothetical protein
MINISTPHTTTTTTGLPHKNNKSAIWTHSAVITGTGAVSATVVVEGTQDPAGTYGWYTIATLEPSGTTEAEAGFSGLNVPACIRHRVTAISGTSAVLRVFSTGN